MPKIFSALSKFTAVLFATLFVLTAVLVLLIVSFQTTLLNAETYKRLLVEDNVYEQIPALLAEESSSLMRFLAEPCTGEPLACAIDNVDPALQTCLADSLGETAYGEIASGQRDPTDLELQSSQRCLDRYDTVQTSPVAGSPDDNPLANASAEVQACALLALGDETYAALYNDQRAPTQRETRKISACLRQERRNERLRSPGIAGELMPILKDFSTEQWQEMIRLLLPAESLQHMTESALDQVFAYLNGETDQVIVSLVDFRAQLTGQAGDELILFLLEAQLPCTEEQQAQINAGGFENGGDIAIYCAASGETLAKMIPGMHIRLDKVRSELPEEIVLIQTASNPDASRRLASRPFGANGLTAIRTVRYWMRFSPLVPLGLLLLVMVFGVRSLSGWLRWWGIPLLIAGLITLGIGLAVQPLLDWTWIHYIAAHLPPVVSSGLGELSHDLSLSLARELGKWIVLESGLLSLLGLAAIIGSHHLGPKRKATTRSFTPPELSRRPGVED